VSHIFLIFTGTRATLDAEDLLIEQGYEVKTLGKPQGWEGGCGLALRIESDKLERILALLEEKGNSPIKAAPPPEHPIKRRLI